MPSVMYIREIKPLRQQPKQEKVSVEWLQWWNQLTGHQKAELLQSGQTLFGGQHVPGEQDPFTLRSLQADSVVLDDPLHKGKFGPLASGGQSLQPLISKQDALIYLVTGEPASMVRLKDEKAKMEELANDLFEATNAMIRYGEQALADPKAMDQYIHRAVATAMRTLEDLAETRDRDTAVAAMGPSLILSPQEQMVRLGFAGFRRAAELILTLGNVAEPARARALAACADLWETIRDGQSLTARDFMDSIRKLREATRLYKESLVGQPSVEFADGILGIGGRLWCLGMGTLLFTVNLAALGPLASFVTPVAQFLGEKLFVEGVPDELKPAAQIGIYIGEVLMAQDGLWKTGSGATSSTGLRGGPEQGGRWT